MMRIRLNDRRFSVTTRTAFVRSNGDMSTSLLITIGFDGEGNAKEVFCADFKAGSELHALVIDACILISRQLQHGDSAEVLLASLTTDAGPSLIGQLLRAAVAEQAAMRAEAAADARCMAVEAYSDAPPTL